MRAASTFAPTRSRKNSPIVTEPCDVNAESALSVLWTGITLDCGLDEVQTDQGVVVCFWKFAIRTSANDVAALAEFSNEACAVGCGDEGAVAGAEVQRRVVGPVLPMAVREVAGASCRVAAHQQAGIRRSQRTFSHLEDPITNASGLVDHEHDLAARRVVRGFDDAAAVVADADVRSVKALQSIGRFRPRSPRDCKPFLGRTTGAYLVLGDLKQEGSQ